MFVSGMQSWIRIPMMVTTAIIAVPTGIKIFSWLATLWKGGPRASANPWRALTLEWQVSSPPPIFNFDSVPTVVGGPYEYGVPGAVHGIFKSPAEAGKTPAKAMAP